VFHAPTTWVAPGAQGCLQVFVVGTDHASNSALWQLQTTPSNGSSNWYTHGAPLGSNGLRWSPAVAPSAGGHLDLFVVGDDLEPEGSGSGEGLYHQWRTARGNGWSGWLPRGTGGGAGLFGSPAVAPSPDGPLELFVLGSDGALWHTWQTALGTGWSDMLSHGTRQGFSSTPHQRSPPAQMGASKSSWRARKQRCGTSARRPRTMAGPTGSLTELHQAFCSAQTRPRRLLRAQTDAWSSSRWETMERSGTCCRPPPAVAGRAGDRTMLPPKVNLRRLRPAVALSARGRLELFVVGDDAALWHRCQTAPSGGWSRWFVARRSTTGWADGITGGSSERGRTVGTLCGRHRRSRVAPLADRSQRRLVPLVLARDPNPGLHYCRH
jgi:hypothetical protein